MFFWYNIDSPPSITLSMMYKEKSTKICMKTYKEYVHTCKHVQSTWAKGRSPSITLSMRYQTIQQKYV